MERSTTPKVSSSRNSDCCWCDGSHDYSESYCFVKNERAIRSRLRPKVSGVADVYSNGSMRAEFRGTDLESKMRERQMKMARRAVSAGSKLREGYEVPKNVKHFIDQGIVWNQIVHEKPWAVYVLINGRRKRKRFNNLWAAVEYHSKITIKYPSAGIVSLARAYELPAEWRFKKEKLPRRFKWCPRCAAFRVYRRVEPVARFYAEIKRWSDTKNRYEWTSRLIWLTECQLCGHTNRDPVFRRANQPYELRRIKPGVQRVKARRVTEKKRGARR